MVEHHKFLAIVHKLGCQGYPLKGIYRRIQDRDLFLAAYGKLYANQGAMTPGTSSQDTVEGMSMARIDTSIGKLHEGTYEWKPVRRTYIPKKKGGTRPLGLPSWSDKLLQEVMRMVLEAYYEPRFSEHSHGFRTNRGCHTALNESHKTWKGTKWFIEGDIKGCFDNIDHDTLLNILERDIKDNRFIKLVRTMLKAGYLENWQYHKTYSGTPQGGVISPILSNIFLNELDKFVETELIPEYNRGEIKADNPEYRRLKSQRDWATEKGDKNRAKDLAQQMRKIPSKWTQDPNYRRLRYNRYADDFLLGFDGPFSEAQEIKDRIKDFLKTINLDLSETKTLITHAVTTPAQYLGYHIQIAKADDRLTEGRRRLNMNPILKVPKDIIEQWQKKYTKNGKTVHRPELLQCSDFEIVQSYGTEFQEIVNYYSLADNVSQFYAVKRYAIVSAVKTIAAKHKQNTAWVYNKYLRKSAGIRHLLVEVENPNNPRKPYRTTLGEKPIQVNKKVIIIDEVRHFYKGRNELIRRLLANECELCGSTNHIRVHHTRKLADIKKRYKGQQDPPPWIQFMIERNRKTVVVCHQCHIDVHAGRYDGHKVK